jgi:hypothetical protein
MEQRISVASCYVNSGATYLAGWKIKIYGTKRVLRNVERNLELDKKYLRNKEMGPNLLKANFFSGLTSESDFNAIAFLRISVTAPTIYLREQQPCWRLQLSNNILVVIQAPT